MYTSYLQLSQVKRNTLYILTRRKILKQSVETEGSNHGVGLRCTSMAINLQVFILAAMTGAEKYTLFFIRRELLIDR